jgi:hypothetical protein
MALDTAKLSAILSLVSFMLGVIYAKSVTYTECRKKPTMPSVFMLNVAMLSVVAPCT